MLLLFKRAYLSLQKWNTLQKNIKPIDLITALKNVEKENIVKAVEECCQKNGIDINEQSILETENDIKKREIEQLNKQLHKFFEKLKNGQIAIKKSYQYNSIGTV